MELARPPLSAFAGLVALLASGLAQLLIEGRVRPVTSLVIGLSVGGAVAAAEAVERWRPGRRGVAWSYTATAQRREPAALPGQPPTLRHLVRVVPIAQSQVRDGAEWTLLSLEAYTDGFLVRMRLAPEREQPSAPGALRAPQLTVHATDDRGGRYEAWPGGGSGDGRQWRFDYQFTPALDPAGHELRVEAAEVRWRAFNPATRAEETEDVQPGPWTFTVPLEDEKRSAAP